MRTVSHSKLYTEYLRSDEWQRKKQERADIDGHRCAMCGRPEGRTKGGLQCHHITYKRLGHEDVYQDLVTVCGSCHRKLHAYYGRVKSVTDLIQELDSSAEKVQF
jgi:5-methylcytosine-specific restriction endonuclease McrA